MQARATDGTRRLTRGSKPRRGYGHLLSPVLAAILTAVPLGVAAQTLGADKLPRFASLRSDDINLRVGPGENYPIEWVYKLKDLPVEVIEEFQNWRQIEDWQGSKGWVLDRMLTDKREVIVAGAVRPLYARPDTTSAIVARAEPGVVAQLIECHGVWCRIAASGYHGWVERGEIWGVLPDETVQ